MTIHALRTDGANRVFYCLTGWGDLPKLRRGLAGLPAGTSVDAWVPAPLADIVRDNLAQRLADHLAERLDADARIAVVGYSHAGLLAAAVARHLAEADDRLRLVLIDTCAPTTFLHLPLANEFFRPAPFPHPTSGPLVSALHELQASLSGRAVTGRDLAEAVALPHRYVDELRGFALGFDPRLARLDFGQLAGLMAEWLSLLLCLRDLDTNPLPIDARYLQSREHREETDPSLAESQIVAWGKVLPRLTVEAVGDDHGDLLSDPQVVRASAC